MKARAIVVAVLFSASVATGTLRAQERSNEADAHSLRLQLTGDLRAAWEFTEDSGGITATSSYYGWSLGGYCAHELAPKEQARLSQIGEIFQVIGEFASARDRVAIIKVNIVGHSDAAIFAKGSSLGVYRCAERREKPPPDVPGNASEQMRIALYRAATLQDIVNEAWIAQQTRSSNVAVLAEVRTQGTWHDDRSGPHARSSDIVVHIRLQKPATVGNQASVDDLKPRKNPRRSNQGTHIANGERDGHNKLSGVSLGAAGGALLPLSADARRQNFGTNGMGLVTVRVIPDKFDFLALWGSAFGAMRADGEILLNNRWEHYSTSFAGLSFAAELQGHTGRAWFGIGPTVGLLYARRLLTFNSSGRDQRTIAPSLGLQADGGVRLAKGLHLWGSASLQQLFLEVPGGVSNPATGQFGVGLLYAFAPARSSP